MSVGVLDTAWEHEEIAKRAAESIGLDMPHCDVACKIVDLLRPMTLAQRKHVLRAAAGVLGVNFPDFQRVPRV